MDEARELELRLIPDSPGLDVKEDQNGRTVIRGYAALYNVDSQPLGPPGKKFIERLMPGAFDRVLAQNPDVFGKYNHYRMLGRTVSGTCRLVPDERGLAYEIDPKPSDADVVQGLERGDIRGSSFAFYAAEGNSKWYYDPSGVKRRDIYSVDFLGDVGPVDSPAYKETEAYVSVRSLDEAARQLGEGELYGNSEQLEEARKQCDLLTEIAEALTTPDSNEPRSQEQADVSRETPPGIDYEGIAASAKAFFFASRLHG